jgi:hypothetical protein
MMREADHERARLLIDRLAIEGLGARDGEWLDFHLESCAECAALRERTVSALTSLRSFSVAPRPGLVAGTRRAVQARAAELRQGSAFHPVWAACLLSVLWMAITMPFVWRGIAWLADAAGVPTPIWQTLVVLAWALPAAVTAACFAWKESRARIQTALVAESEWRRI